MTEGAGEVPVIDAGTLEQMLLDPETPDEMLRPWLRESVSESTPFHPVIEANPARIRAGQTEAAVLLASLNKISRRRRQRRYRRRISDWQGLRIVSEGDSWFQYPFLLTDVVDWLSESYAVLSLDAAGDLITDMVRQGELLTAVVAERPDVILLSGGGNDLLGSGSLARMMPDFREERSAADYAGAEFEAGLRTVLAGYTHLLERLTRIAPATPVLCHVYDYAIPDNGRWLGRPLAAAGIRDPDLQRAIIRIIVDRFHSGLTGLAERYAQLRVVDTRGAVQGLWHDELHPTDRGYAAVAQRFAHTIAEVTGTVAPVIETGAGAEAVIQGQAGGTEVVYATLAGYGDDALLAELGRRRRLREAGALSPGEPLLIFPSSLAMDYPGLREAGGDLLSRLEAVPAETLVAQGLSRSEALLMHTLMTRRSPGGPAIIRPHVVPGLPAARLISRLAIPGAGGAAAEAAPGPDREERIDEARRVLKHLAEGRNDIDETVIDRLILDAEEALRRIGGEGPEAKLGSSEALGLEAVIEADGSRPVLFVQDGTIDLGAQELQGSLARHWRSAASGIMDGIRQVASAVGAVQLPAFGRRRIGTAFAIAPGIVITNRHVLEEIATFDGGKWEWKYDAAVDFAGEYEREAERPLPLAEVLFCGPDPINRTVSFARLDVAVIRVGDGPAGFPKPLTFDASPDRLRVGTAGRPRIYVMGFPARPPLAEGSPDDGPPPPGHEYQEILEKLYANRFGSKRWAPGLVEAGPGQLAADTRGWVMSHDASTLGGSSGSCVVNFADGGSRVAGLHFGGRPRVENYAHVVAALQRELSVIEKIRWV